MKELTTSSHLYIQETMQQINTLVKVNDYKEVQEITELNLKNKNIATLGNEFIQFISWHHLLANYNLKEITYDQCIEGLEQLIGDNDNYQLKQSFQDLKIKNVIGNILTQHKQYEKATRYYQDILSKDIKMEQYYKLKLKVYFNLSKLYFLQCDYQHAYEIAKDGIYSSIKNEDMSVLASLYVQAGQALSMIVHKDEHDRVLDYYNKAIQLYTILNLGWYVDFVRQELIPLLEKKAAENDIDPTLSVSNKKKKRRKIKSIFTG